MTRALAISRPNVVRLTIAVGVLGVAIAILTTARASEVDLPPAEPVAIVEESRAPSSLPRIGFRHGRPHVIEVVELSGVEVELGTARAFLSMQAAAARDGIELRIESGFRTAEHQLELYRAWRQRRGNKAARPGSSNHQSGRALDIVIPGKKTYAWLKANAATFRFKRTVKGEPWHWEYVDAPIARDPSIRIAKVKRTKAKPKVRPSKHQGARGEARVAALAK